MTITEKTAQELIELVSSTEIDVIYREEDNSACILSGSLTFASVKKIASIICSEIIKSSPSLPILSENGSFGSDIELSTKHWKQVLKDIEQYNH
jgi:hypothetical protein